MYNKDRKEAIIGHAAEDFLIERFQQKNICVRRTWELLNVRNLTQTEMVHAEKRIGDILCLETANNSLIAIECCSSDKYNDTFCVGNSKERLYSGQWYCFIGPSPEFRITFISTALVKQTLQSITSQKSSRKGGEAYKIFDLRVIPTENKLSLEQFISVSHLKKVENLAYAPDD